MEAKNIFKIVGASVLVLGVVGFVGYKKGWFGNDVSSESSDLDTTPSKSMKNNSGVRTATADEKAQAKKVTAGRG